MIRLTPDELPKLLASHQKKLPKAIQSGLNRAAHRGRSHLVRVSPVDTGMFKNSWRVRTHTLSNQGPELWNDAPHAGIIEGGARPHKVNAEGIAALTAWAKRKLAAQLTVGGKDLDKAARSVAFAIAKKLEKQGQKGRFITRDNMAAISRYAVQEVARAINKALAERRP